MNRLVLRIAILTVLCLFLEMASPSQNLSDEQPAGKPRDLLGTIETPLSDSARAPSFEQASAQVDHASIAESIMPLVLPRDSLGLTRRYKTAELSYTGAGNEGPGRASGALESSGDSQSPAWTTDIFAGATFADQQGELYTIGASFERRLYKELSIAFQPFGGGMQYAGSKSWPRDGSHFNWRPQGGFGVRFNTGNSSQLLFGAKYVHISNGGINDDSNCGVDEIFLYGGFQLTF
ncbi:MAG: acyloxyacyl hydrolase [Planctomycetes bacterium]|nr:acyloxyacyl hydrolase [Planctomycetota bacterium]